ncbi:beta-glucosidase 46-like isoform X2 [Impatiens glandulifera]|uniref:beta-glucosidase 46-like isoform X2 n=1 Tax=Impatiens glandulifera TaxID=253017 RepID=UPI001FB10868|nr:beta-glucosidase 46-like isoform X2 [Impatiens glandulifera]
MEVAVAATVVFEGAYLSDGKGWNNWDVYTHKPGTVMDGSNGDIAVDQYHRYKEDIELMEYMGVNSYRFSISWSRILPKGRFGELNMAGIQHYNNLIDALLHKGIHPFVTLNHFDVPQELEDRYKSWLSTEVQKDFKYYADICFKYFGDRVKYWTTFNEPNVIAIWGYRTGLYPPSRCSIPFGNCSQGNSDTEPFIAAHNIILSHAIVVHLYRTEYQHRQRGSIGIALNAIWFEPISESEEDNLATERALSFYMNWFLDPIMFGKYPEEMQAILGSTLPTFTEDDKRMLDKGLDFIGINHYSSYYVKDCIYSPCEPGKGVYKTEGSALWTQLKDGKYIGEPTTISWLKVYPQGLKNIVIYLKDRYNNTPMFIAENGFGEFDQTNSNLYSLNDVKRVEYLNSYLDELASATRNGADVRGYFIWSLLDNFEWTSGYTTRFGIYHVNYTTLQRTPKSSAYWYKEFISGQSIASSLPVNQLIIEYNETSVANAVQ